MHKRKLLLVGMSLWVSVLTLFLQAQTISGVLLTDSASIDQKSTGIVTTNDGPGGATVTTVANGQFIDIKDQSPLQLGKDGADFALSFWFKMGFQANGETQIIGTTNQYGAEQGFIVYATCENDSTAVIRITSSPPQKGWLDVDVGKISFNTWVHVAINYTNDGSASRFDGYLNLIPFPGGLAHPDVYNSKLRIGDEGWGSIVPFSVCNFYAYNQKVPITEFKTRYQEIASHTSNQKTLLISVIDTLKAHVSGTATLSASRINALTDTIGKYRVWFGLDTSIALVTKAFELTAAYELSQGALFIGTSTRNGFNNTPGATDGFELARAVFSVQQAVHDFGYAPDILNAHLTFFNGKKYASANHFPGACAAPSNASTAYTAKINASVPPDWGRPTCFSKMAARRPTGYYLAPGSIATVTVPVSMVNKNFEILVGASTRDKINRPQVRRFFRVTKTFPITGTSTKIANPFGGGIYINVPYSADLGAVDIQLTNVVPAPLFSAQSISPTTLAQWQTTQRRNTAPWADFVSDKFMMQVPTNWIYNYDDPVTLMQDWDKRMDGITEYLGYPPVKNNYVQYLQVDLDIMSGVYGIGYPQINATFNPNDVQTGNANHWWLKPGRDFWETEFHETGHAMLMPMFYGETEAAVNIFAGYILNVKYGMGFDSAFSRSSVSYSTLTRDQAALNWMTAINFRAGRPMDISGTTKDEVQYQHRGYGKYFDIGALFSWDALKRFYYQDNLDYIAKTPSDGLSADDSKILRMSVAAGADLRPLIHFWGVQPKDTAALKAKILAANLKPSQLIYDRLLHYKSIIPMTNTDFRTHASIFLNKPVANINASADPDYGDGWYAIWIQKYGSAQGDSAKIALQNIIDRYFNGRPAVINTIADAGLMLKPGFRSIGRNQFALTAAQNARFMIVGIAGRVVLRGVGNGASRRIDCSRLGKGNYIVQISSPGQNITQRFMVR